MDVQNFDRMDLFSGRNGQKFQIPLEADQVLPLVPFFFISTSFKSYYYFFKLVKNIPITIKTFIMLNIEFSYLCW